jgi:hypothetical protein
MQREGGRERSEPEKECERGGITTFCGPLNDVPHLITRTVVKDGSVDLFVDLRPRAYAAYEARQADGGYGGGGVSEEWSERASERASEGSKVGASK